MTVQPNDLQWSAWVPFDRSIDVNDEGYVYVADVGNQRIQKFAPY